MIAAILFLQVLAASDPTPAHAFPNSCRPKSKHFFARKADLPEGVLAVFGAPMAEKGEDFQITDVVRGRPLPFDRFVSGEQRGCTLRLVFEHGGRSYGIQSVTFMQDKTGWHRAAKQAAPTR